MAGTVIVHNGLDKDLLAETKQALGLDDVRWCSLVHHTVSERTNGAEWVLALGNDALKATTGHSGVMNYRGKIIGRKPQVMATISPAMVRRQPGRREGWLADLQFFKAQVLGRKSSGPTPRLKYVKTDRGLSLMGEALAGAKAVAYDVETTRFDEFEEGSGIVTLSCRVDDGNTWALPLYHPESPWEDEWVDVLKPLGILLASVPKQIAHNGKFDARWLRRFHVPATVTFDTMLASHILDENQPKALKSQARMRLGVEDWDLNVKDYRAEPLRDVLKYNGLDAHYTFELYLLFRELLLEDDRARRMFTRLLMPAVRSLIDAERRGVWTNRLRLKNRGKKAQRNLDKIERQLMKWVPPPDEWPEGIKKPNFNRSNFALWWLFDYLGMPVLERSEKSGSPSMAEDVLLQLREEHPAIKKLLERTKWQKYVSSFFRPYQELIDSNDRIHTVFKVHGTVTGRLSSGKIEIEKVAARSQVRGVNLQQVPRDSFVRGLFGAPPGRVFVEADFSQVELRVAAFLSRDDTMLGMYQRGEDIHTATAASVMGVPPSKVTAEQRKRAKAVNFGFLYGMGAEHFVHTAFTKYDMHFSLAEAKAVRRAFFQQFSGLTRWHDRQRQFARKHHMVISPMGRVRHLPDVASSNRGIRAEAERQAINSPVQAMASDMTLLSLVILDEVFEDEGMNAHVVGTVHDALTFEVDVDNRTVETLETIKYHMENLPLEEQFGVTLDVPIIADLKVGQHWGDAVELEEITEQAIDTALNGG